jgi:hypothetical protein
VDGAGGAAQREAAGIATAVRMVNISERCIF